MKTNLSPYDYDNLRKAVHDILYDFLDRELDCAKGNEFDFEFLEAQTDKILRLIKRQGGTY